MKKQQKLNEIITELQNCMYCFRISITERHNSYFMNYLQNYKSTSQKFFFQKLGDKNPGKVIYISNCTSLTGFFAQHRYMLQTLSFADKYGMLPVVDYTKGFTYSEKEKIYGTKNPFEYYFEQPANISLQDAYKSMMVVFFSPSHHFRWSGGYLMSENELNELVRIQKKYIRLNKFVEPKIHKSIQQLIGTKKTLGVHVRGTDFNRGFDGHPKPIPMSTYFKNINSALEKYNFKQIFLATDDIRIVKKFQKQYHNLILYENMRSASDINLAFKNKDKRFEHYQLGYEVLLDMMTLSSCQGFIAGPSQVSFAAMIEKKARNEEYEYIKILYNGLFRSPGNFSYNAPERIALEKQRGQLQ